METVLEALGVPDVVAAAIATVAGLLVRQQLAPMHQIARGLRIVAVGLCFANGRGHQCACVVGLATDLGSQVLAKLIGREIATRHWLALLSAVHIRPAPAPPSTTVDRHRRTTPTAVVSAPPQRRDNPMPASEARPRGSNDCVCLEPLRGERDASKQSRKIQIVRCSNCNRILVRAKAKAMASGNSEWITLDALIGTLIR